MWEFNYNDELQTEPFPRKTLLKRRSVFCQRQKIDRSLVTPDFPRHRESFQASSESKTMVQKSIAMENDNLYKRKLQHPYDLQRPMKSRRFNRSMDDCYRIFSDIENIHQACKDLVKRTRGQRRPNSQVNTKLRCISERPNCENVPLFTFRGDSPWSPRTKFPRHIFPIRNKFR